MHEADTVLRAWLFEEVVDSFTPKESVSYGGFAIGFSPGRDGLTYKWQEVAGPTAFCPSCSSCPWSSWSFW